MSSPLPSVPLLDTVPLYRVYKVDADDHIVDAENVECANDEEACAKALQLKGDYPVVEVWEVHGWSRE